MRPLKGYSRITLRILWGYSGGHFEGNRKSPLEVLQGHWWYPIIQLGGTLGSQSGHYGCYFGILSGCV